MNENVNGMMEIIARQVGFEPTNSYETGFGDQRF